MEKYNLDPWCVWVYKAVKRPEIRLINVAPSTAYFRQTILSQLELFDFGYI